MIRNNENQAADAPLLPLPVQLMNNTATETDFDLVCLFITPYGPEPVGELLPWAADPNWTAPAEWSTDTENQAS